MTRNESYTSQDSIALYEKEINTIKSKFDFIFSGFLDAVKKTFF